MVHFELGEVLVRRQAGDFEEFTSDNAPTEELVLIVKGDELVFDSLGGDILIPLSHTYEGDSVSVEGWHNVQEVKGLHKTEPGIILIPIDGPIEPYLDIVQHIAGVLVLFEYIVDIIKPQT